MGKSQKTLLQGTVNKRRGGKTTGWKGGNEMKMMLKLIIEFNLYALCLSYKTNTKKEARLSRMDQAKW